MPKHPRFILSQSEALALGGLEYHAEKFWTVPTPGRPSGADYGLYAALNHVRTGARCSWHARVQRDQTPWGTVHGGCTAPLLDSAMACRCDDKSPPRGSVYTTLEIQALTFCVRSLGACRVDWHSGRRITSARFTVWRREIRGVEGLQGLYATGFDHLYRDEDRH